MQSSINRRATVYGTSKNITLMRYLNFAADACVDYEVKKNHPVMNQELEAAVLERKINKLFPTLRISVRHFSLHLANEHLAPKIRLVDEGNPREKKEESDRYREYLAQFPESRKRLGQSSPETRTQSPGNG